MRFIKKRNKFLKENTIAPSRPKIAPPIEKPIPPVKPTTIIFELKILFDLDTLSMKK